MGSWFDLARRYVLECSAGESAGLRKYGPFDPRNDRRVMCREAMDEARDIGVYMKFLALKHPDLSGEATRIRRLAFRLWCELDAVRKREEAQDASRSRSSAVPVR